MIRIPLTAIRDNPFQTRTNYTEIEALATSIYKMLLTCPETSGLVQVPPARLYDVEARQPLDPANLDDGDDLLALLRGDLVVAQLAAGHRRLRAFEHLVKQGYSEYKTFPVELAFYTDESMADLMWTENHDRADLSAIEEAESLQRDMQAFKWIQEQVAQRRGLSRSAVANKLRLLKLPEAAQTAIRSGALSERHGRVLLRAQALTPKIYKQLADEVIPVLVPDEIVEKARQIVEGENELITNTLGDPQPCAACGTPTKSYIRCSHDAPANLCASCYRSVSGWEPPTVATTENELSNLIHQNGKPINFFPTDVEIGTQGKCTDCPLLQNGNRCLDHDCHKVKTAIRQGELTECLVTNIRARFPNAYPGLEDHIRKAVCFEGFSIDHLSSHDETDRYLANSQCLTCQDLVLDHSRYDHYGRHIQLTSDPFVVSCKTQRTHTACVRKLAKSPQAQAALAEKNLQLAESIKRKQQAQALRDRAMIAMAIALRDGKLVAWAAVAKRLDRKNKDPYKGIAKWFFDSNFGTFSTEQFRDWTESEADKYRKKLLSTLGEWGVTVPAGPDELIEKVRRVGQFIEGHGDLTPEQIGGNLDNLKKLLAEVRDAAERNDITADDMIKLKMTIGAWRDRLERLDASRLVNVFAAAVSQETEEQPA